MGALARRFDDCVHVFHVRQSHCVPVGLVALVAGETGHEAEKGGKRDVISCVLLVTVCLLGGRGTEGEDLAARRESRGTVTKTLAPYRGRHLCSVACPLPKSRGSGDMLERICTFSGGNCNTCSDHVDHVTRTGVLEAGKGVLEAGKDVLEAGTGGRLVHTYPASRRVCCGCLI